MEELRGVLYEELRAIRSGDVDKDRTVTLIEAANVILTVEYALRQVTEKGDAKNAIY